jgi:uncharacterized membrane protein SpoIIM required for sporulation
MKETRFIAQNKEKWLESENLLKASVKDPEKLGNLFTQVVDDLSYSRTYYPNRSVRVYLNKIAREYFSIIYSHQKEKRNKFKIFWLDELPQIVIHSKRQLLISLFVFLFSALIGIFSASKDPQFTSSILGESYVSMTKENIEKGDPMAVYKTGHQVDMFLGITLNNLMVAFRTYVFGIFLSIGTLAILLYNGIMVGCFQFFFIERGLFLESALTIWLHGTLEISSIILAGGAGLTLGSGLLFPGTYSRLQAFQISAIRSLKLMIGITPIFVLAGIIESFLTRYTDVPDALRFFLILLSAIFIIGYFVIYPWLKFKKGFDFPLVAARLAPSEKEEINYNQIKNNAELIRNAFVFYKKYGSKLTVWIATISAGMAVAYFFATDDAGPVRYSLWWQYFLDDLFFALKTPTIIFVLINTLGSSLIIYRILIFINAETTKTTTAKSIHVQPFIQTFIIVGIIYFLLFALNQWGTFLLIFSFMLFLLFVFAQLKEKTNLISGFSRTWSLASSNFGQVIGLQLILIMISFSFLMVLSAPLIYINTSVLEWNFAESDTWARQLIRLITLFIRILGFNLILPILAACAAYLYFSLNEVLSASFLKRSISTVGEHLTKRNSR